MYKAVFSRYQPTNEQEAVDKELILAFLANNDDALLRTNLAAHVTASAIVVNPAMDKVLFAFHNIYRSWSWVGGHNDGDPDLLKVAIQETKEETGVKNVIPYSEYIFMLDVIFVPNHVKKGMYVPDHLHLNAAFLLIAAEDESLAVNPDENSGVKWFPITEVLNHVGEERMIKVYQKAFAKIATVRKPETTRDGRPNEVLP